MAPKKVNRKYDVAAMTAIVLGVEKQGSVSLTFPTRGCAAQCRMSFYLWRKNEQELNGDPSFLQDIVVRIEDTSCVFQKGFGNDLLRKALSEAGLVLPVEE